MTSKLIELLRRGEFRAPDIDASLQPADKDCARKTPQPARSQRAFKSRHSSPGRKNFGLTERELQIVGSLVQGQTNKDVAAALGVSEYTVKHHLTRVFDKLGVYNRLELVLFAINQRLGSATDGVNPNQFQS